MGRRSGTTGLKSFEGVPRGYTNGLRGRIIQPMQSHLNKAIDELNQLLPVVRAMGATLDKLGQAMLQCWNRGGKVLVAGNGGSATDAMHLAGEFSVRFIKNRKALAAIALCDPSALTAAGNDFGFDTVFSRQVEALGKAGDMLILFTTSGKSANILRAIEKAKSIGVQTVSFLGKDGGAAKGLCDIEFLIPSNSTARVQEAHKVLFHALCDWIDTKVD